MLKMKKRMISVFLIVSLVFSCLVLNVQADESEITSSGTSYLYGDVDIDGKITIRDSTVIQKYLIKLKNFSEATKHIADVDNSGDTNVKDATLIQKYVANLIDEFPVGEYYTTDSADWRTSTISYEIFVRSFCDSDGDGIGDFRGIASKASYLKDLNVGCVF